MALALSILIAVMAVFLAGYRNGARRQRDSKSTRVPMYLPEPAWFLDRVKTYSTSDLLQRLGRGPAVQIQHANVVGLAVLGAGVIYSGNLTPFDLESDLLWRYWGRPEACYTVEVQRFFSLAEPVAIYARKSDCQGISSTKVNLQDWIFLPATDVDLECFNLVDDEALHALGDCNQCPVLWVPEVVLSLIKVGKWKSLLFHYSRGSHRSGGHGLLNALRKIQERMNWPSQEEMSRLWNCRYQFHQPPHLPLTEQSASFLIQKIREHSSVLLSGVSDAGVVVDPGATEEEQRIKLEEALEGLQVFSQAMSKENVSRAPRAAMNSALIIDSIRAARHLRNRGQLALIQSAVIDGFVPSHLRSFARSIMFEPASKTTVSRYQVWGMIG